MFGDMGADGEDGEGPVQFSVHGCAEDHGEATAARERRELVLPIVGESNEGDRDGLDTDINPPEAEYGHAIYCNAADSGPMRKGYPAARRAGSSEVVGTDGD